MTPNQVTPNRATPPKVPLKNVENDKKTAKKAPDIESEPAADMDLDVDTFGDSKGVF